jgi:hypothetical protein
MNTTQNAKATMITFHTNKKGVRYATYFNRGNFRMKLADAKMMIANGTGIEEAEVKW